MLPSEQAKPLETLLHSEQSESDKQKAEWLKTLLPKLNRTPTKKETYETKS